MDLGTANTLLYTKKTGIVINEPSVVEVDALTGEVLAVGAEAKRARGKTPRRIISIRPMKNGVIADFDVTRRMMLYFIRKAIGKLRLVRPSMVICIPTGITQVEKKAVIDAAIAAGAMEVSLIEEPMAAAVGAGLPVLEPSGSLVADIGGGTSEVAVITLSAITVSQSVRTAGDAMNEAILRGVREHYRLDVGENTAEQIKFGIGSVMPLEDPLTMPVSGKDLVTGVPKTVIVADNVIREALRESVEEIAGAVMRTLEKTPPELAADIYETGFLLTGGGALLRGLSTLLAQRTQLKVHVDDDPLTTVLRGTAKAMLDRETFKDVFIN